MSSHRAQDRTLNDDQRNNSDLDGVVKRTNALSLNSNGDSGKDISKSTLNPAAMEFVMNPAANEFVPRFLPKEQPATVNHGYYNNAAPASNGWATAVANYDAEDNGDIEGDDYIALGELKEVIDSISQQPAVYESLIEHITDILNNCVDEDEDIVLQCVVNNVVDQAIIDPNFRYNGVRMCIHFIENLKIGTSKGTFKDILLQRCQREFTRRDSLARATDGGAYLRGVTLFLADLSTRLSEKEVLDALPELIQTILKYPNKDNVKCACNVLKLAGPGLEKYNAQSGRKDLDKTFERLQRLSEVETNTSIVNIIINVVEYKERGWQGPPPSTNIYNPYAAAAAEKPAPLPPAGGGDPPQRGGCFLDIWYPPSSYQPLGGNIPPPGHPGHQAGLAAAGLTSVATSGGSGVGGGSGGGGGGGYQSQQTHGGIPSYDFGSCGDEQDNDVCDAFDEFLRTSGQMK